MEKDRSIKKDFKYKLEDLIDINLLQTLQTKMNDIYSFPSSIIDNEGKILVTSAWQEICSDFHRKDPLSEIKCIQSDKNISRLIDEANPVVSCRCPHGMIDTAVPIVIDGHHLANFFTGQIFLEPPDINVFKKQARKYGYDEKKYLKALSKVPVWTQEKLDKYLAFAKQFTEMLAEMGYKNLQEVKNREKLVKNQYYLSKAQEIGAIGTWELDIQNNKLFWTEETYRIFGVPVGTEMNYKFFLSCIHPEDRDYVKNRWEGGLKKEPYDIEHRIIISNGSVKWVREKAEFEFDEKGNPLMAIGFTQDITERKRAEKKLKESELRFKNLADLIPQPVWETDLKFNITYFNRASYELSGYTQKDFKNGLKVTDLIVPEDKNRIQKNISKLLRGYQFPGDEYTCLRKDGIRFPILIYSSLITRNEKPVGVRGIALDITDRKRIEKEKAKLHEQLLHSQKMEALGALAGGIAHDFNNILGVISGYTELIYLNLPEPPVMKRNLKKILSSSEKAKKLVQQILMFSRKSQSGMTPLMIGKIIQETMKFLRSSIPSTIKIRTRISKNISPVYADEIQINQVIMNLCTNAAHAMKHEGGLLDISLTEEKLDSEAAFREELVPGIYQKLTIADTGCGIPAEIMNRIFEPYFTTKDAGEGTGLGLSVVHGIVKSHMGAISVASKPGHGTSINILLPIAKEKVSVKTKTDSKIHIPGGNESVLLVDDDQALLDMSKQMLEELGYKVIPRTSSIEALEFFKCCSEKVDLLITDMTMPNMTGLQLAKEIHQLNPGFPVILCTGFSDQINEGNYQKHGISGFVMKPMTMKDIGVELRKVLDKNNQSN